MNKPKTKQTEIYISLVFDGKQASQQAFIGLILHNIRKNQSLVNPKPGLDSVSATSYNKDKVFSDVRVG